MQRRLRRRPRRPRRTYVGSAVCAGCHQGEAKLWTGSHHKLAMDHATDTSVLGDFSGATFEHYGVKSRFFRRDGKFYGRDRRAGRKARRVRNQVHVRRLPLAAISDRISRRAPAGARNRLGQPPEGQGRSAMVPPLSQRGGRSRRHPALDEAQPELEFHVRRMPLDRRAQELRRGEGHVRHHMGRDQRRLRDLSWAGLGACRLGA